MTPQEALAVTYPALFGSIRWGVVCASAFEVSATVPDRATIQSVNVVPFVGDRCVVVEAANGRLTLPGGTRELGESLLETAQRELIEEAGATIASLQPLGYWQCHSEKAEPWRPFLAHPDYVRLVLAGDVVLIHEPTNPNDGEQIVRVTAVDVVEASTGFMAGGQPELADLYNLAAQIRSGNGLSAAARSAFDEAMAAK